MANNYLQFSFDLIVPESQREWVSSVLDLADEFSGVDDPDEGDEERYQTLCEVFPGWSDYQDADFSHSFQKDDGVLWIYAEESGNTDNVVGLLKALLKRCHEAGEELRKVGFTYSETCSAMRVGEFGGGAVCVFVDGSEPRATWMNAHHWLTEEMDDTNDH